MITNPGQRVGGQYALLPLKLKNPTYCGSSYWGIGVRFPASVQGSRHLLGSSRWVGGSQTGVSMQDCHIGLRVRGIGNWWHLLFFVSSVVVPAVVRREDW